MELRSSAALACSEESGRSRSAAAKRAGGMGVAVADMSGLREERWSDFLVGDWEVLVIYKLFGGLELGWSWRWVAEMEGGSEYTERGCFLGRGSLK